MSQGYDFSQLYGMADMSGAVRIDQGVYDAVTTKSEWGKTKGGDKGQWTVTTQITTGQYAGTTFVNSITISPVKNDGEQNARGLGAMFRHLAAHGIPVPPSPGMPGGFWELGWTPEMVAQQMVGKPVQIVIKDDEYEGVTRSKIRDYQPPRPGAPTQVEQRQQPQQPQGQLGYPYPPGNNGYAQQPQYAGQPQGPVAPGPWQNAQQPPQGIPGAPAWAQPPVPGAGGMGEFTGQGQSFQGYQGQPNPYEQQPQQPQPGPQYQAGPGFPQGPQPTQDAPYQPQGYGAPATGAPAPGAPYQQGAPSPGSQVPAPPWAQQPPQQGQPQEPPQGQPPAPPWQQ